MSEPAEELKALLASAAKAGPGPERLASVRARLEAQLGPLDAPGAAAPAAGSSGPGATSAIGVRVLVGVVVVVGVGLATWLGAPSASETAPTLPAPVVEPAPPARVPAPSEPSSTAPPSEAHAAPADPGSVEAPVLEGLAPRAERAAPIVPRPSALEGTDVRPSPSEPGEADPGSSLREEIALLDRALRASEAGDTAGARAALAEHRARFPTGTLRPERERMWSELSETEPPE